MENLFGLEGKTAVVTGAAQGLGRMIAEGLLRAGVKVYITSRRAEVCDLAAREMGVLGNCIPLRADLSTANGAVNLCREVIEREEALHLPVNNAGKTWGAPLESFPDKAWESLFCVNVQTPFTLVRELLPLLVSAASPQDPSRIINIGSVAGAAVEQPNAYSYAASKAAVHHLSRVLAANLAGRHITVNAVLPGYFPTQMISHIRKEATLQDALERRIPLGRLGSPEDIVGICVFLASRAGAYVTGAEIPVDGGLLGCT